MPTRLIEFDAAADRHFMLAAHHLRRREIHGVEARSAEAVDLHAGHRVAKARRERAHARDVAACFADRIDATHHDVVDLSGIEFVAILDRFQRRGCKAQSRRRVQRSVDLAAPARGAHMIVDEGFAHRFSLRPRRASQVS